MCIRDSVIWKFNFAKEWEVISSHLCHLMAYVKLFFVLLCFVFLLLPLSKASIIGRKKEAVAEKLQEAMDEVWWVHANLNWSREGYLAVALCGNWRRNFSRKKVGRKFCMLTCTKRVFVCKDKLYNLMRINLCILLKTKKITVKKKTTGLILYEGAISRNENTRIHLREPPKTSSALVVVPMKNWRFLVVADVIAKSPYCL